MLAMTQVAQFWNTSEASEVRLGRQGNSAQASPAAAHLGRELFAAADVSTSCSHSSSLAPVMVHKPWHKMHRWSAMKTQLPLPHWVAINYNMIKGRMGKINLKCLGIKLKTVLLGLSEEDLMSADVMLAASSGHPLTEQHCSLQERLIRARGSWDHADAGSHSFSFHLWVSNSVVKTHILYPIEIRLCHSWLVLHSIPKCSWFWLRYPHFSGTTWLIMLLWCTT